MAREVWLTSGDGRSCVLRSGVEQRRPEPGELVMPVWTVRMPGGEDERIAADMLLVECGALMALSEEALLVRAWAPGEWRTVLRIDGGEPDRARERRGEAHALVGLPRG